MYIIYTFIHIFTDLYAWYFVFKLKKKTLSFLLFYFRFELFINLYVFGKYYKNTYLSATPGTSGHSKKLTLH